MNNKRSPHKYKAFISYSHKDKDFAQWLHRSIEKYVIPRALREKYPSLPKNLKRSIFRDDEELAGAVDLSDVLKTSLAESECLIVICSPNAVDSKWVEEEIQYFQHLHGNDAKIFAIIKGGEPRDVIPDSLQHNVEPLAIDAREKQQQKQALVKTVASILGVDFALLWAREKRERGKRLFLTLLLVLVFVGMGVYLYLQSSAIDSNSELDSIKNEIHTLESKLKRPKISENEIAKISQRLKILEDTKKVKIDTLKWFGLLHSSMAYKAKEAYNMQGVDAALSLLESSKSMAEDEAYAKKNMLRAKLYIEKYDFIKATHFYEKAVRVDASYENVYDYALFLMKEKQIPASIVWLEKLRGYDLSPENKANVLNRLGIAYRNLEQMDQASKMYGEALGIRKVLAQKNVEKHILNLAWTYNNLGVLYKESKVYAKAEEVHMQAFKLRKSLAEKNPKKYTFFVTCSMHNLAELYSSMHDKEKANTLFQKTLKLRRALFVEHPNKYMPALASTLHELGALQSDMSNLLMSETYYVEALKYRRILAKENPQAYADALLETLKGLKVLYTKSGQLEKAKKIEIEIAHAA